ncbi:MAG: diguanylate cyclase [Hylemonella sp.]|nr:diguanylate cyclase [Hylemonella sp.]
MKSSLAAMLLGPPGRRRAYLAMVLLTMAVYLLFALLQAAEVLLGFIDATASAWLTLFYLGGSLLFYGLLRSGWSERLAPADPALTLPQTVHGVLAMVGAYAITGPARGAVLAILVLVLAYSMFSLTPRQARGLALFTFILLALTMAWKSQTEPLRYPLAVEGVHLAFGVIVLGGISVLSVRMGALRERLRRQKQELEASLEQIRLLAIQDELTGLVNRRHMMELVRAEQKRQLRSGEVMSVVLLDLDHFKQINDSHGHQAGDIVLRTFAQSVLPTLRAGDVLARWGGEEFLLALPGIGQKEALQVVQRMRESLAQVSFDAIAPGLRLSFSAGLAACQPGDSIEAVIELADKTLYRAKQAGRNCTLSA